MMGRSFRALGAKRKHSEDPMPGSITEASSEEPANRSDQTDLEQVRWQAECPQVLRGIMRPQLSPQEKHDPQQRPPEVPPEQQRQQRDEATKPEHQPQSNGNAWARV